MPDLQGGEQRGEEVRLVAISESRYRTMRTAQEAWGGLLGNTTLNALTEAWDSGITAEEAEEIGFALGAGLKHRSTGRADEACPACRGRDKLIAAFPPSDEER